MNNPLRGFFYRLGLAIKEAGERANLAVLINVGLMIKERASK